jgi:lysophospholipase L1-like esterase
MLLRVVTLTASLGLGVLAGCSRDTGRSSRPKPDANVAPDQSPSAAPPAEATEATPPSVATKGDAAPGDASRKGSLVVHVGDSFAYANFEQSLRPRFASVGARYWVIAKTNTYTASWLHEPKFEEYLFAKPDLVLMNLGANELEIPNPRPYAVSVRELVAKVARWARACVWITPPTWKKDTGYLGIVRDNCAPCLLFDSDEHVQDIERQPDGIHPNKTGGARWADAFWDWLEAAREPARGPWFLRAP